MLTRIQKQKNIEVLKEKIEKQKIIIFTAFDKLKAKDVFELRKKLKTNDAELKVVKKTLLKIAFREKGIEAEPKKLDGQVALIFGFEDEISPAKIAFQFSKENQNFKIIGGYFDNEFRSDKEMIFMAEIPSKKELLGNFTRVLAGPISNFINVLQGNIKGLIYVLMQAKNEIVKKEFE